MLFFLCVSKLEAPLFGTSFSMEKLGKLHRSQQGFILNSVTLRRKPKQVFIQDLEPLYNLHWKMKTSPLQKKLGATHSWRVQVLDLRSTLPKQY